MPYSQQYADNLLEWAETELVGFSPLGLNGQYLCLMVEQAIRDNSLEFMDTEIDQLRSILEQLRTERRNVQSRDLLGDLIGASPEMEELVNWINSPECSVDQSMKDWALDYVSIGETYEFPIPAQE